MEAGKVTHIEKMQNSKLNQATEMNYFKSDIYSLQSQNLNA